MVVSTIIDVDVERAIVDGSDAVEFHCSVREILSSFGGVTLNDADKLSFTVTFGSTETGVGGGARLCLRSDEQIRKFRPRQFTKKRYLSIVNVQMSTLRCSEDNSLRLKEENCQTG